MKKLILLFAIVAALPRGIAQEPPPKPSPVREVIVIIKTHFDIGYTHRVSEIVRHYRTDMIDKAMDIMDQSKSLPPEQRFAWTGPGWVMSKVLEDWDGQTPARRQRLDEYVKSGRFQFHALPFTLESDACEPEEMARGFIFTSNLCRTTPFFPASGPVTRSFNGLHPKSNFLAITDAAIGFLDKTKRDTPFLLYFSYYTVHGPLIAPPALVAK